MIPSRFVSEDVKKYTIEANENLCKPLSVSEARKLGDKGEIILEDELNLDRYIEELQLAENKAQIPRQLPYEASVFFFAARGSVSVVNAILGHLKTKSASLINEKIIEAYIDGLVQFGDFKRAMSVYKWSQNNGTNLRSFAYGHLVYGAVLEGKSDVSKEIIQNCEDAFLPPEIREKIVS
jgi:hypothetical protein